MKLIKKEKKEKNKQILIKKRLIKGEINQKEVNYIRVPKTFEKGNLKRGNIEIYWKN